MSIRSTPGLDLIPAGRRRATPTELLTTPRMAELLAWAESRLRPDPHRLAAGPGRQRRLDHRPPGRRSRAGRATGQESPPAGHSGPPNRSPRWASICWAWSSIASATTNEIRSTPSTSTTATATAPTKKTTRPSRRSMIPRSNWSANLRPACTRHESARRPATPKRPLDEPPLPRERRQTAQSRHPALCRDASPRNPAKQKSVPSSSTSILTRNRDCHDVWPATSNETGEAMSFFDVPSAQRRSSHESHSTLGERSLGRIVDCRLDRRAAAGPLVHGRPAPAGRTGDRRCWRSTVARGLAGSAGTRPTDATWTRSPGEWILLGAVLLVVVMQLIPWPQPVSDLLSPHTRQLLPLWRGDATVPGNAGHLEPGFDDSRLDSGRSDVAAGLWHVVPGGRAAAPQTVDDVQWMLRWVGAWPSSCKPSSASCNT